MSTTTLKLPFKRFVAQVSTGAPRSKSTYLALMAENLAALQACPWREAADVPASLTGHDFTAETQFSDAYDAFKLTGNYDNQAMTEIAYAGMAAYRFTVPASATTGNGVPVTSVSLPISRDRFEKSGVHLAVALSDSATPSTEWATVHGSGDLAASSQLAQMTAANLMAGAPDEGTVTIDLSGVSSGNPSAYIWVYVTLEDYTSHWTMYNAKEQRLYAIEGSAMLSGDGTEVTFDGEVSADAEAGARYLEAPIRVRVSNWMYPSMPKLHFRTLHKLGYGAWKHLVPMGEWAVPDGTSDFPFDIELDTAGRRLPTGGCILECWSGGDQFVPGMPYGCVYIPDASEGGRADITLTRTSPSIPRIDLAAAIRANSSFDAANAATDRSKFNTKLGYGANVPLPDGANNDLSGFNTTSLTRVRIVRQGFDDEPFPSNMDVLIDTFFDLSVRSVLTEADIPLRLIEFSGESYLWDLDYGTLNQAYNGSTIPSNGLKSAEYAIVIGDGDVMIDGSRNYGNDISLFFKNVFEVLMAQTATTPDSSLDGTTYQEYPTLRWSHTNTVNKAYPLFRVRFFDSDAANAQTVYDSGPLPAPPRDGEGMYEWTAPVKAGDTTLQDVTLQAGTTYYWAVSMLDAKYTGFNTGETRVAFSFAAA